MIIDTETVISFVPEKISRGKLNKTNIEYLKSISAYMPENDYVVNKEIATDVVLTSATNYGMSENCTISAIPYVGPTVVDKPLLAVIPFQGFFSNLRALGALKVTKWTPNILVVIVKEEDTELPNELVKATKLLYDWRYDTRITKIFKDKWAYTAFDDVIPRNTVSEMVLAIISEMQYIMNAKIVGNIFDTRHLLQTTDYIQILRFADTIIGNKKPTIYNEVMSRIMSEYDTIISSERRSILSYYGIEETFRPRENTLAVCLPDDTATTSLFNHLQAMLHDLLKWYAALDKRHILINGHDSITDDGTKLENMNDADRLDAILSKFYTTAKLSVNQNISYNDAKSVEAEMFENGRCLVLFHN